jgi:hypothetical protein
MSPILGKPILFLWGIQCGFPESSLRTLIMVTGLNSKAVLGDTGL